MTSSLSRPHIKGNALLSISLFAFTYYWFDEPMILTLFAASFTVSLIGCMVFSALMKRRLNLKLCLIISLGITFCFSYQTASHALVFDALETATADVLDATGGTVDTGIITGLFAFFRVIVGLGFVILIAAGVFTARNGDNWGPIASAFGIAVFAIVAIEVVTNMLVGT